MTAVHPGDIGPAAAVGRRPEELRRLARSGVRQDPHMDPTHTDAAACGQIYRQPATVTDWPCTLDGAGTSIHPTGFAVTVTVMSRDWL